MTKEEQDKKELIDTILRSKKDIIAELELLPALINLNQRGLYMLHSTLNENSQFLLCKIQGLVDIKRREEDKENKND